jgi:hypothetical protein
MAEQLTGVWVSPAGPRVEVDNTDGVWRAWTYSSRRGGVFAQCWEYDAPEKVLNAIRGLEAEGYRFQPDLPPDGARTVTASIAESARRQWTSPPQLIGAALLFAVILIVGVWLMR